MDKEQKAMAEKILQRLESQKFADWYAGGALDAYISGFYEKTDPRQPTKEKILEDIVQMFKL